MKFEDLPDVLTIKELQQYLRVGKDRAYKIGGEIAHIRNGNRKLFLKEKVREWLNKQAETKMQRRTRTM